MDYSFRNSTGSTVSEVFNAVLNSPLPIEFIYISHPFGTSSISPTSNTKSGNNNKWAISSKKSYNIDFNFDYMKYIKSVQEISNNNIKKNISTENLSNFNNASLFAEHGQYITKNNNFNKTKDIYDGLPKLILNTIRKAWISPDHTKDSSKIPSKLSNFPCNMQHNKNDNEKRIKTFSTFSGSSHEKKLIRRYSVPEIEIRKYEVNQNTELHALYQHFHKLEKPPQKLQKIELTKNNSNLKLDNSEPIVVASSKMDKNKMKSKILHKQETTESDKFVSELLIKNHTEDFAICDLLIENLNSFLSNKNSSLYISPEEMEHISSRGMTYEQTLEIPENIYIEPFESEETNYTNRTTSNDDSNNTLASADSLESSSNNNNKISLGIQVFPESFEIQSDSEKLNDYVSKPNIFQKKKIIPPASSKNTRNGAKRSSAPKPPKKTVINSLQAYKFDSRGNLQFSSASSLTAFVPNVSVKQIDSNVKNSIVKKFNSGKSSSTTASKSSFRNNRKFKKITMFEGQNQSTPDVEMGPKRFYQKTEIFDGDNKIDILEIIECLQSSPPQRPDFSDLIQTEQAYSKIPIRINRFNLNKKLKPNSGKRKNSIIKVRPKFSSGQQHKEIIPIQTTKIQPENEFLSSLKPFPKLTESNNFDQKKGVIKIESLKKKDEIVKLQPISDPLNTTTVARSIKIDNESVRAPTTPTSFEQTISIPSSCTALRGSSSNSLPSTILPKVISTGDRLLSSVSNKDSHIYQTNNSNTNNNNIDYHNTWRIPSTDYCDTTTTYKKIETMQLSLPLSSCKSTSSVCCKCESPVIDLNHANPTSVSVCSVCSRKITPRCFLDNFFDNGLFSHHGLQNECRLISCSKSNLNRNYNVCTDCNNSCIYSNTSSKSSCKPHLFQSHKKNKFHDNSSPKILENNCALKKTENTSDCKPSSKIKPIANINKNFNKVVPTLSNESKTDVLNITPSTINPDRKQEENPVWHITVSGPPDFKMELSFSKDSKNVDIEQTINGVSKRIDPNINEDPEIEDKVDTTDKFKQEHCIYKKLDECDCSVNVINLRSNYNSPIADLSILGNTICPEKKPKAPTMSERDLTRRRNQYSRLNI